MTEQMTETPAVAPPPPTLIQKLAAEAIGTAVLVYIGCGAVTVFGYINNLGADAGSAGIVNIGLAFGIAIVMMAYVFGRVSGGHFNPAVSLGAALSGRLSWKDAGAYTAAQVVGGLIGGAVLMVTLLAGDVGWEIGDPMGSNGFGDQGGVEMLGALIIEIVLTFIFLMVILGVTDERNDTVAFAPLAIGLALAAIHFVGIPATGTSVNPARSIGVAFESGSDAIIQLWLFIVAPLIGGAIAGLLYPLLFNRGSEPVPGSGFGGGTRPGVAAVPGLGAPDQFQQQWSQQGTPVAQPAAAAPAQEQPAEQPIIQDGWQWDPAAQQWIPAQQPPAPQPGQQGGWAPPPGDQTQVRPPDA